MNTYTKEALKKVLLQYRQTGDLGQILEDIESILKYPLNFTNESMYVITEGQRDSLLIAIHNSQTLIRQLRNHGMKDIMMDIKMDQLLEAEEILDELEE